MEQILFQAFCRPQNLKENMKFWKADWSDVEFQIRIMKYGWYIQSIYFLHRFAKEHWKRVFLDGGVSSLILHCPTFFECTVLKWTKTVPVQLGSSAVTDILGTGTVPQPGALYLSAMLWQHSRTDHFVLIVPSPYSRAGVYSVARLLSPWPSS